MLTLYLHSLESNVLVSSLSTMLRMGSVTDARPNPPATQNGASAAIKLQKARELLANKAALKAQIQALKVDQLHPGQQSPALRVASLILSRFIPTITLE